MLNIENIFILFCPKLFTIQLERNLSCSVAILGMPPLVIQEVKTPDQALYLLTEIFLSQICQSNHPREISMAHSSQKECGEQRGWAARASDPFSTAESWKEKWLQPEVSMKSEQLFLLIILGKRLEKSLSFIRPISHLLACMSKYNDEIVLWHEAYIK